MPSPPLYPSLALSSTTTTTTTTTTATKTLFTFAPAPPGPPLTFPFRPSSSSSSSSSSVTHSTITPLKRTRPITDVDGELSFPGKKKRRLRLFLITSRLSRPFSSPASNIVDRGSSKIAVWAKQKSSLGRHLLRKAAILNRVRRLAAAQGGGVPQGERERRQLELARLAFVDAAHEMHTRPVLQRPPPFPPTAAVREGRYFALSGSPNAVPSVTVPQLPHSSSSSSSSSRYPSSYPNPNTGPKGWSPAAAASSPNSPYNYPYPPPAPAVQLPRRQYIPLPPSPLGLSNYDALDLEDEILSPYSDFDDDADAEMHDSPCTTASYASAVSTSDAAKTPPQARQYYSDFSILEPSEAVVGDYDGVDGEDGVEPVWPDARLGGEMQKHRPPGSIEGEEEEDDDVMMFRFY